MSTIELDKTIPASESARDPHAKLTLSFGSRTQFEVFADTMERLFDVVTVASATLTSYYVYEFLNVGKHVHYSLKSVSAFACFCALVFMLLLENSGAYRRANSLMRIRETERILKVSFQVVGLIFPLTFFSASLFSRGILLVGAVLTPTVLIAEKQIFFFIIEQLHLRSRGIRKVIIYGAGHSGKRLFSVLVRSTKLGLYPVAIVDDNPELQGIHIYESGYKRKHSTAVTHGPLTAELIRRLEASTVIVAIPSLSRSRLDAIASQVNKAGAIMAFVPQVTENLELIGEYADIDGLLIAYSGQTPPSYGYASFKRAFDFVVASLLLGIIAPLWGLISLLIRLDSPGPVLFEQLRVGEGGSLFKIFKFRTMKTNAPRYGYHPTDSEDPRLTKFGSWLRRTSLDELPQLLNVIKGEMSLVGPRPEMPFIVETYQRIHRQRLEVIPGITGLWQLSADRAFPIHENIQCDLYYIRNRNFFMDVAILLHTFLFAMRGI